MNNNQRGCLAEYLFATVAMQNGFNVSMPLLDASPYDSIIEKDNKLYKIQIKHVSKDRKRRRNDVQIVLRRTDIAYKIEEVDFFAIYFEELDGFFVIKNTEQKSIRLSPDGIYKNKFNNFVQFT
jgi:hypothetical protein